MDQIDGINDINNVKNSPRWRKKTKQLATLGPASSSFEMIEKLFLAGECYSSLQYLYHILSLVLQNICLIFSSQYVHILYHILGADVFRLNFSHGEHSQKQELLNIIRAVEAKYDHPIAILGDLQGPKLRVGTFANKDGEVLEADQTFRLDLDDTPGTNERVMLPHPEIIEASEVGHELLIDDGKMKLEVIGTGDGYLNCKVVVAGRIKDRKVSIM